MKENNDELDTIIMDELLFYGYHGVMEEEKSLGQKFSLDILLYCDLKEAGRDDDLNKTVDYALVYELIKGIVEKERYKLLEALAERISSRIMEEFPLVQGTSICIKKPGAPIPGAFDHVGVEIRRDRYE